MTEVSFLKQISWWGWQGRAKTALPWGRGGRGKGRALPGRGGRGKECAPSVRGWQEQRLHSLGEGVAGAKTALTRLVGVRGKDCYSKNPHTRTCGLRTPRLKFGKKKEHIYIRTN